MQQEVVKIIKEISKDLNLPIEVVTAIVESQFQYTREVVKLGEAGDPSTFLNIRFKHLGILVANHKKIIKFEQNARITSSKDI